MGAVHFSIDPQLVELLKQLLPLEVFVETGTFEGEAVQRIRPYFEEIHSVESSEKYFASASERFNKDPAIHLYLDDSPRFLRQLVPQLRNRSVLYWFDAHWCEADASAGKSSQCPLLQELESMDILNSQSVILIDDARLFLCPPPAPHEVSQWPDFDSLVKKLHCLSSHHLFMVVNDTILYFPVTLRNAVRSFAHEQSINWLTVLDRSRDYDSVLMGFKAANREISNLIEAAKEKDEEISRLSAAAIEKDEEINRVLNAAEQRLGLINHLDRELSDLRRSRAYRLGFALLNPRIVLKRILRKTPSLAGKT